MPYKKMADMTPEELQEAKARRMAKKAARWVEVLDQPSFAPKKKIVIKKMADMTPEELQEAKARRMAKKAAGLQLNN